MISSEEYSFCENKIYSEEFYDFIFEYSSSIDDFSRENPLLCARDLGSKYGIVFAKADQSERLDIERYTYMSIPKLYGLMDTISVEATGAIKLQNQLNLKLTGKGVMVGFIDTGINIFLDAFITKNKRTRIYSIWDQTKRNVENQNDYGYGTIYTKKDIQDVIDKTNESIGKNILLMDYPTDDIGHGTDMAAAACGSTNIDNTFTSPAIESDIIVVKLKEAKNNLKDFFFIKQNALAYEETDIMMGIKFLRDEARKVNKPLVIVLGIGTNQGEHTGSSPLGDVLNAYATTAKYAIVVAGGNEGNKKHHFYGQLGIGRDESIAEINVGEKCKGFTMELWGDSPDIYTISITSPYGETTRTIMAGIINSDVITFVLEDTIIYVTYKIVEIRSGKQLIIARFENPTEGIWKIKVTGQNIVSGVFNIWLPIQAFIDSETFFITPNPEITLTEPSNVPNIITNSGYDALNNSLYIATGRGYARSGYVKPDICSPSVNVTVPVSNVPNLITNANQYKQATGTSLGAALTAGVCAQFMEWGVVKQNQPLMKTTDIKNYLIRGANRNPNLIYPNREFGYGTIDGFNSFTVLIK